MLSLIELVLGGALLIAGRRLYWLLAGTIGLVAGLYLADLLLPSEPESTGVIIALAMGAGGALLMIVFQKTLIGLVGFLAGGIGLNLLIGGLTTGLLSETWMSVAVFIIGGVIGAILLSRLFSLGLVLLSAVIGAYVLLAGLAGLVELSDGIFSVALIALIAMGIVIQIGLFRR